MAPTNADGKSEIKEDGMGGTVEGMERNAGWWAVPGPKLLNTHTNRRSSGIWTTGLRRSRSLSDKSLTCGRCRTWTPAQLVNWSD